MCCGGHMFQMFGDRPGFPYAVWLSEHVSWHSVWKVRFPVTEATAVDQRSEEELSLGESGGEGRHRECGSRDLRAHPEVFPLGLGFQSPTPRLPPIPEARLPAQVRHFLQVYCWTTCRQGLSLWFWAFPWTLAFLPLNLPLLWPPASSMGRRHLGSGGWKLSGGEGESWGNL